MPVTSEGLHRKSELEGITLGLGSPKEVLWTIVYSGTMGKGIAPIHSYGGPENIIYY